MYMQTFIYGSCNLGMHEIIWNLFVFSNIVSFILFILLPTCLSLFSLLPLKLELASCSHHS